MQVSCASSGPANLNHTVGAILSQERGQVHAHSVKLGQMLALVLILARAMLSGTRPQSSRGIGLPRQMRGFLRTRPRSGKRCAANRSHASPGWNPLRSKRRSFQDIDNPPAGSRRATASGLRRMNGYLIAAEDDISSITERPAATKPG